MGGYEEKDWAHCVASLEPHAVSAVIAGSRNSLAICGDGRLFTWGWNQRGTLGQPPETKTESSPGPVEALAGVKIVRGATSMGSAGRSLRGRKMAQGRSGGTSRSRSGALPSSKFGSTQISTPVRMQGLEKVRVIAVGAFHNLALPEDGILWAWGNNEYGQLGTGDTQPRSQPIRVQGYLTSHWLILLLEVGIQLQ